MKLQTHFYLLILFFLPLLSSAQEDYFELTKDRKPLFWGGSFDFQIGSTINLGISPQAGIRISPSTMLGVSTSLMYYKTFYNNINYESFIYGGSIFARQAVMKRFVLQAELEPLHISQSFTGITARKELWITRALIGGGLRSQLGERIFSNLLLLWNLNQHPDFVFPQPIIKLNIEF